MIEYLTDTEDAEVEKFMKRHNENFQKKVSDIEMIYYHEVNHIPIDIQAIEFLKEVIEKETNPEKKEKYLESLKKKIPKLKNNLKKLKSLEGILKLTNLSENELRNGTTNFYNLFSDEKEFYYGYLKNSDINSNIAGYKGNVPLNPEASRALVSTIYGNSIKWALKGTQINQEISLKDSKLKILIENEFGEKEVRSDIGFGKGTGTKYIETFTKNLKGNFEKYKISKLGNENPIYGVEIKIPLK